MSSKKHSGSWFEKERERKEKENEKLSSNMFHWLTQNSTSSQIPKSITSSSNSDNNIINKKDSNEKDEVEDNVSIEHSK